MTDTNTQAQAVKLDLTGLVRGLEWQKSEKVDSISLVAHCAVSLQTYFAADENHAAEIDDRRAARILAAINADAIAALVRAGNWLSVCAQTTGGTVGRDNDLVDAVSKWSAALARLGGGE